jgi:predicted nucleic acid-binding protein
LHFRDRLASGDALLIGPVRQEALSGFRSRELFERMRLQLRAIHDTPLVAADFEQGAQAWNACQAAGITPSATDMLICVVAQRLDVAVFTTDRDFERYAAVLGVRLADR